MEDILRGIGAYLYERAADHDLTDVLRIEVEKTAPISDVEWTFFYPSLTRDPNDPATLYLAADLGREREEHKLLVFRRNAPGELDCEVRDFGPANRDSLRHFVDQIDTRFLPRPQKDLPAIAVGNRHPEISLPAAFDAFGRIFSDTGVNMASTVQLSATREMTTDEAIAARNGEDPAEPGHTRVSIEHLYHAGLWAAVRAGWRRGYTAEADHFIVSGARPDEIAASTDAAKEAIRRAAGYTKFTTDTSRLFQLDADPRHPNAASGGQIDDAFRRLLTQDEQAWALEEFSRPFAIDGYEYSFSKEEVQRLSVKFSESLKLNEQLYDYIREQKQGAEFDFEPSIDEAETLTTPKELLFYMHWLKERGRPARLVPPNLGFKKRQPYPEAFSALEEYAAHKMWPELLPRVAEKFKRNPLAELADRVTELAAVARHFEGTLSVHSGSGKQARALQIIGQATRGQVNYKISGELQLQLFDVLAEQPEASPWRRLFQRMTDRCYEFADKKAFGEESELAKTYRGGKREYDLGSAAKGRVDGNRFLIFWLGNVVGSRDLNAPDGDQRFFKDKLDELPKNLVAEVRRRNSDYVVWLAKHLRP